MPLAGGKGPRGACILFNDARSLLCKSCLCGVARPCDLGQTGGRFGFELWWSGVVVCLAAAHSVRSRDPDIRLSTLDPGPGNITGEHQSSGATLITESLAVS